MKHRQVYLRRKCKNKDGVQAYAISGMVGKKDMEICAIGTAENLLLKLLDNPHFFTKEKGAKIYQKYLRINQSPKNNPKNDKIASSSSHKVDYMNSKKMRKKTRVDKSIRGR